MYSYDISFKISVCLVETRNDNYSNLALVHNDDLLLSNVFTLIDNILHILVGNTYVLPRAIRYHALFVTARYSPPRAIRHRALFVTARYFNSSMACCVL